MTLNSDLTSQRGGVFFFCSKPCFISQHDAHNFSLSLQSDLEVFLHGFSDVCDVVRRSDQVVFGIEHRLHRQVSDPES